MKKQIILIHGGDSFDSYDKFIDSLKNWEVAIDWFLPRKDWKMSLQDVLGDSFQVLSPQMPNKQNARYAEWKIWFERMLPFIEDGAILIGNSLGGIFLAKYLSENVFPKKIGALMLVAAPHSETPEIGDFALEKPVSEIAKQCGNIYVFQSKDDHVVMPSEADKYKNDLPEAKMHIFEDRGHFNQEEFPEIIEEINNSLIN